MKKFLITFEVLYDGVLTSKEDIGELTLEIEMDEERIRKKRQFIESENDYDFDEYNHRFPVNYVAMYVKSAKVVKACNLTDEEKKQAERKRWSRLESWAVERNWRPGNFSNKK